MEKIEIKVTDNKEYLEKCFEIRKKVFVYEQKVSSEEEYDGLDKDAKHFILFQDKTPIGCARLRYVDDRIKLERIAVLKEFRGHGYGDMLVDYLIDYCRKESDDEVYMNAQYYLKDFYKKHGFVERGKTFFEAGIKHIEMYLKDK